MSATEKIARLRELVRKCYGVVVSKNGEVPEVGERNMENLPNAIASTHDALEELTITQNGIYTPEEGVDGFSKVTAEFDTSSLPKVKVSSLSVNDSCINNEGRWDGESLIDTSKCTTFYQCFYNNKAIKILNANNWDVSNITNFRGMFQNCDNIESIDCKGWDISNASTLYAMFWYCRMLKHIDVSNWDTRNVNDFNAVFRGCDALQKIDLTRWDASNTTSAGNYGMFNQSGVISIIGDYTIDDVVQNNISCLNGLTVSFNTGNPTNINRASLRALINGLADLTGQTAQTLTIGNTNIAKLTEEDIAIATSKNWTIA